ncbi:MAG: anhydro-N-acetylmuramic acid kinase, partial [Candidatus Eremiobacteraeota bacterium]|nr:anhydro-N-acetylmuramic acid kinase [Candidatus Eremiobacteraeota bacterium]
ERFRVALNLGGIANLTILCPRVERNAVTGWDVGPGNMLLDEFVRCKTSGTETMDVDGAYAQRGRVDAAVLEPLLEDPYFARQPPKSTGREYFGRTFLQKYAPLFEMISLEDGCATLVALTVEAVARAVASEGAGGDLVVSGGGVHNRALMSALQERLPLFDVGTSARFGIDPEFKEAQAFIVLGYELLRERPAGLPAVTGAKHSALLGAIAPRDLTALLLRVREELDP